MSKLASNLETSYSRELTCTFWDFNHLYWSKNGTRDEIITIEWTVSSTSRNPFLTSVQCFPLWCTNLRILQRNTTSHNSSPAASDLPQRGQTAPSGKLRTLQTTLRLIPSSLNLYICGSQLMQFSGVRIINYDESVTKTKQTKAHSVSFTWTIEAIQIEVTLSPHTSLDSVGIEKTRGVCLLDKSATFSFFTSFTFSLKSTSKTEYFSWSYLSFYECQEAARHGGIFLQSQLSVGWGRKRLGQSGLHSKIIIKKKKKKQNWTDILETVSSNARWPWW